MMRKNFQLLADKFSSLNESDNKDFISFYEKNEDELKRLKNFENEEELYLAVVTHHTYGRSQLYEKNDLKKAEHFLNTALTMICEYKDKFKIDLTEDTWYLQSLQHLLTTYLEMKDWKRALATLDDLKVIDEENRQYYEREEKEIRRIHKFKILLTIGCIGIGFLTISIVYRFIMDKPLWYVGRFGGAIAFFGLVGAYFFKNTLKTNPPNIVYKSGQDRS